MRGPKVNRTNEKIRGLFDVPVDWNRIQEQAGNFFFKQAVEQENKALLHEADSLFTSVRFRFKRSLPAFLFR